MKFLKFLLILFLLSSCGAYVDYDYDKNVKFSEYKTYNFFGDIKSGLNELDENRLLAAIDSKMKLMGYSKSESPSFNIDIQTSEVINSPNSNVGVGIGGTGRNVGGGVSIGIPVGGNRPMRQVKIEFVDAGRDAVIWEAITTQSNLGNTPEKREESFNKLVERVFKKFPPKS
ncbi:DUF4136 domain-containing protein [Winogradskyella litorisediminis]|uniref:DUF4136 domain-containing protein n=1 Tax=Winogradskyella litorisediminis TaxID=1156618 RepID=A0ABW3N856_9FLAO